MVCQACKGGSACHKCPAYTANREEHRSARRRQPLGHYEEWQTRRRNAMVPSYQSSDVPQLHQYVRQYRRYVTARATNPAAQKGFPGKLAPASRRSIANTARANNQVPTQRKEDRFTSCQSAALSGNAGVHLPHQTLSEENKSTSQEVGAM